MKNLNEHLTVISMLTGIPLSTVRLIADTSITVTATQLATTGKGITLLGKIDKDLKIIDLGPEYRDALTQPVSSEEVLSRLMITPESR